MKKVMFDTNVNDAVAQDGECRSLLIWALEQNKIELITTHIQIDQINEIKDQGKRFDIYTINGFAGTTTTQGFISGLSRLNWASLSLETDILDEYLGSRKRNKRNLSDALIASTAQKKCDIFVTNDKSLYRKAQRNIKTFRSFEFRNFLRKLKLEA